MKTIFASLLLLGVQLVAAPVEACLCAPGAQLLWPREDARDVARQVPLLLAVYGDTNEARWQLETASGDAVATTIARTLEVEGLHGGNCALTLLFVSSADALAADTAYRVRLGQPSRPDELLAFRTGRAEQPEQTEQAALEYDRLADAGHDGPGVRLDGVEIRLAAEVTLPSLLLLRGAAERPGVATLLGSAFGWSERPSLSSAVASETPCVEVEQIDMSGNTLATRSLCTPDRCARLGEDSFPGSSSCDAWFSLGDDFWDALPAGSCDSVPTVHIDEETGAVDVEGFGDEDDRVVRDAPASERDPENDSRASSASGCVLAPSPASRLPMWLIAPASVLCGCLFRRRRACSLPKRA